MIDSFTTDHRPGMTLYLRPGLSADAVLEALKAPGEILKNSSKSTTRKVPANSSNGVGDQNKESKIQNPKSKITHWVVKESRPEAGLGILKRTLYRNRYRQAWLASIHLEQHGILAPIPFAFIEKGRFGIITGNAFISEYLDNCHNVEQHAAELAPGNADLPIGKQNTDKINTFLANLAQTVNQLCAANVYHADLSGKNIFTPKAASAAACTDGRAFYFIDLDGVIIGATYTEKRRMKNHVQLYDSFCDLFDDHIMAPFIERMMPPEYDIAQWFPAVQKAQKKRRARTVARWKKQGRL